MKANKTYKKILKMGNSYAITIPIEYIRANNLEAGDVVEIYYADILCMQPIKKQTIEEMKQRLKAVEAVLNK
jgi:antitoxin component of MazEF toxin-antitoxin module